MRLTFKRTTVPIAIYGTPALFVCGAHITCPHSRWGGTLDADQHWNDCYIKTSKCFPDQHPCRIVDGTLNMGLERQSPFIRTPIYVSTLMDVRGREELLPM